MSVHVVTVHLLVEEEVVGFGSRVERPGEDESRRRVAGDDQPPVRRLGNDVAIQITRV